jgi:hypothetical protein
MKLEELKKLHFRDKSSFSRRSRLLVKSSLRKNLRLSMKRDQELKKLIKKMQEQRAVKHHLKVKTKEKLHQKEKKLLLKKRSLKRSYIQRLKNTSTLRLKIS